MDSIKSTDDPMETVKSLISLFTNEKLTKIYPTRIFKYCDLTHLTD